MKQPGLPVGTGAAGLTGELRVEACPSVVTGSFQTGQPGVKRGRCSRTEIGHRFIGK